MIKVSMTWKSGIRFEGTNVFGQTMVTDGSKAAGGNEAGFNPTELLLYGMASCTGVDVVRILQKQRQAITGLTIDVIAHQNDKYPKPFHTVEVKYVVRGENLNKAKVAKAIELSESKYCVVSQTVQNETKVTTSFEILPE